MKPVLLVLSPGFPVNEQDSTCLPALQMFLREPMLHAHFEIKVISLHYPFDVSNYSWHGIPVTSLMGKNKKGLHRFPLYFGAWFRLKKQRANRKDTMVLSIFATEAALIASYFCRWHSLKHVCWIMGQDAKRENRFIKLLAKGTRFIVMSEFLKTTFESNFKQKVFGTVPSALFLPGLPAYSGQVRTYDFMSAGSLIPLKRFEWVIQILADLKKENIKVTALLAGEGPEKTRLKQLATSLGVEHQVTFCGELTQAAVIEHMMKSRIFLHPSVYEGFGNVLIEALYAGCQVVSLFDPLTETVEAMHRVNDYEAFYTTAKHLLLQPLVHHSYTQFNTEHSARAFLELSTQLDNFS